MSRTVKWVLVVSAGLLFGLLALNLSNGSRIGFPAFGADFAGGLLGIFLVLLAMGLYVLPTIVAVKRGVKAEAGIAVVNLFLGWTFLGWVVALAWAASGEIKPKVLRAAAVTAK